MPIISSNVQLGTGDYPLNHARILYDNLATESNTTVSSQEAGFPASALANPATYEFWKPSALPAKITVDLGSAISVDCVAFGAHSFNFHPVNIDIEYSFDNSTWTAVSAGTVVAGTAAPVMVLFDKVDARYWRACISGTDAPQIGVFFLGKCLQMQRPFYGGHTPINYGRVTEYVGNMSEGGQILGTSIVRRGTQTSFAWQHLKRDWVDANFNPFIKSVRGGQPFFIAWNPLQHPQDVGYVFVGEDIRPSNMGIRNLMEVSFTAQGLSDE